MLIKFVPNQQFPGYNYISSKHGRFRFVNNKTNEYDIPDEVAEYLLDLRPEIFKKIRMSGRVEPRVFEVEMPAQSLNATEQKIKDANDKAVETAKQDEENFKKINTHNAKRKQKSGGIKR